MTTDAEMETVPKGTPALILELSEGAPTTPPAEVDVLADARAEARIWSPNTKRAYVAGWRDFTSWCFDNRCVGLPAASAVVGRYLEHLVETEGKTLATASPRRWRSAAAHRLARTRWTRRSCR